MAAGSHADDNSFGRLQRGTRSARVRAIMDWNQRLRCRVILKREMPMAMNTNRNGGEAPVLSKTQAREGVTGHNVRYVLAISTVAIVIAFGGLWLYYFT
jgi:hypothetical protein